MIASLVNSIFTSGFVGGLICLSLSVNIKRFPSSLCFLTFTKTIICINPKRRNISDRMTLPVLLEHCTLHRRQATLAYTISPKNSANSTIAEMKIDHSLENNFILIKIGSVPFLQTNDKLHVT